jgi:two-component system cell cycle sensor histidine kinase/response regulator CckA
VHNQEAQAFLASTGAMVNETQTVLEAVGSVAEVTGGNVSAFRAMDARARRGALASLTLIRISRGKPTVLSRIGKRTPVYLRDPASLGVGLRAVAATGGLKVLGHMTVGRDRAIGIAFAARPRTDLVVYAEVVLPTAPAGAGLTYAIYLGSTPSPSQLLAGTLEHTSQETLRTTQALALGTEPLTISVATQPLGGLLGQAPFLVLGLGALGSALLAGMVGMHRRRSAAIQLANETRNVNTMLDALIVAQQQVEAELRASEERYRLFVELSPDMIALQVDGQIAFINRTGAELLGFDSPDDLVGKPLSEIVPGWEAVRLLESGGAVRFREHTLLRRDGTEVEVELACLPAAVDGRPASHLVARDISERKRAEAQQEQLEEHLRGSQKLEAVGRLAGGIAHDFNNLLTVIGGYADRLLGDISDGDSRHEDVEEIAHAAAQASALTRQLLTFSRQRVVQPTVIDLNKVVGDVDKMFARLIGENIKLVQQLAPTPVFVKADRGQLEQVLANLVINARDALPDGGVVTVTTGIPSAVDFMRHGFRPDGERYATLSVKDNGTGMTDETRQRIFEPFFTTKNDGEGTGLGLAIVYGVLKQLGGEVFVDSAPGAGTELTLYLPATDESPRGSEPAAASEHAIGNESILLVEDNDQLRVLAERALVTCGYRVVSASSPLDALDIARDEDESIDLLVTDVVLPEMSGTDLARSLSDLLPGLRVLYMSGYTDGKLEDAASGGHGFIAKPFLLFELERRVREVLDAGSEHPSSSLNGA